MKTDRHDTPEWITSSNQKRSKLKMTIPGLIGTAINIGELHFASQALVQGRVKNLAKSKNQLKPLAVTEIRQAEHQIE